MKLTFLANAGCIYEEQGYRLLADPWLTDGAFEGSWFHYPPLKTKASDLTSVDALYLSHLHPDHYDRETLRHFRRDIPILVLREPTGYLPAMLRRDGFTNVHDFEPESAFGTGPFELTLYAPFERMLFHDAEVGNIIDSALHLRSGPNSVFNANDNTPSVKAARELRDRHGRFTVAQLNYNAAGAYPSCFSGIDQAKEHERIIERNLNHLRAITRILEPEYVQPFAGQYVIGGRLWEKNRTLGTTTQDHAAGAIAGIAKPLLLNEGQTFDLDTGRRDGSYYPTNRAEQVAYVRSLAGREYPHERNPGAGIGDLSELLFVARDRLWRAQERLGCFPKTKLVITGSSWWFAFDFQAPGATFDTGIGQWEAPYLECTMDSRLLLRILKREAHWNNAEIGCHIEFRREPDVYLPDAHLLMSYFHA